MKKILYLKFLLVLSLSFSSICTADSITLDFKLERKIKSNETITAHDRKTGESIYFDKNSTLNINDIKKAECHFEKLDGYYMSVKSIYDEAIVYTDDMMPTIDFYLTDTGQKKIASISSHNVGLRMGLFIDNKFIMAPVIHGKIEGNVFSLVASGAICIKESRDLVDKINKDR